MIPRSTSIKNSQTRCKNHRAGYNCIVQELFFVLNHILSWSVAQKNKYWSKNKESRARTRQNAKWQTDPIAGTVPLKNTKGHFFVTGNWRSFHFWLVCSRKCHLLATVAEEYIGACLEGWLGVYPCFGSYAIALWKILTNICEELLSIIVMKVRV